MTETANPQRGERKRERSLSPASQRKNYVLRLKEAKMGVAERSISASLQGNHHGRNIHDGHHTNAYESAGGSIAITDVKKEEPGHDLLQCIEQHDDQTTIKSSELCTPQTVSSGSARLVIDTAPKQELSSKRSSPTSTSPELPYRTLAKNSSYGEVLSSQAPGHNPQAFVNPVSTPKSEPRSWCFHTFDSYYENQLIRPELERKFFIQNDFFGDLRERFSFGDCSDSSKCYYARVHLSFGRTKPPSIRIVCYVMEDAQAQFSTKHVSTIHALRPGVVKKFRLKFLSHPSEIAGPGGAALIQDLKWSRYDNLDSPELPDSVKMALQGAAQDGRDRASTFSPFVLSWKTRGAIVEGLDDTVLLNRMVSKPFPPFVRHMLQFFKVASTRGGNFQLFFILKGPSEHLVETGLTSMVEICQVAQQKATRGKDN